MFDITGLDVIKMLRRGDWQGAYYLRDGECVAKTCSACREILPVEDFGRSMAENFHLANRCLSCNRAICKKRQDSPSSDGTGTKNTESHRTRRDRNNARTDEQVLADRKRKRPSGKKRCKTCRITRPLSEFSSDRGLVDGLQPRCKTCWTVVNADYRTRTYIAYWKANDIPLRCYVCGGPYEHSDHVIPTVLDGIDDPENRLPMCAYHNQSKNGTPLLKWLHENHPDDSQAVIQRVLDYGVDPFTSEDILVKIA